MPIMWSVVEYDLNQGRIFDLVTNEHAADINIGDEIIAVLTEHVNRPGADGSEYRDFKVLDFGRATLCRVVDKRESRDEMTLIYVEPLDG